MCGMGSDSNMIIWLGLIPAHHLEAVSDLFYLEGHL